MTEYKTMRVPKDAWETAQESKRENETWGEFLQRCSKNPPEIREFVESRGSNEGGSVSYDDVKAACQAAIRDELPDGVFR